jgi:hypothetical protein
MRKLIFYSLFSINILFEILYYGEVKPIKHFKLFFHYLNDEKLWFTLINFN